MPPESLNLISEYCENLFFRSLGSDKLLVFLPSVNGKGVYPYYPRKSWAAELAKEYNVLYISDPYQPLPQYEEPMGSWFISPSGESTIEILSEKICKLQQEIGASDVIFYGSSMGGYAALALSSLLEGSKAIAECPQLYLKKHPGSRFVCENILNGDILVAEVEPLGFLKAGKQKHIRIVCSILDRHYSQHVIPFVEELTKMADSERLNVSLYLYLDPAYKKGHVALQKKEAFRVIQEISLV